MVKKIGVVFISLIVFCFSFIYFAPKENLYFALEKELKKYHIIIDHEQITPLAFGILLEYPIVYYQGIDTLRVMEMKGEFYLFYDAIELTNIRLNSLAKNFLPTKVDRLNISYSVLKPFVLSIVANGVFGKASGVFNIKTKKLQLFIQPSKLFRRDYPKTLRMMHKNKKGEYFYEKSL